MSATIVNMSRMAISSQPDEVMITYSLGSCIGILIHDPRLLVCGLMHCMLPDSSIHQSKAETHPYMFVDTGLAMMLDQILEMGCQKEDLVIKAAGAASMIQDDSIFKIGEHNTAMFHKILQQKDLESKAESLGGNNSRAIRFEMKTGKCFVKVNGKEAEL